MRRRDRSRAAAPGRRCRTVEAWMAAVRMDLSLGYGVEDIAIRQNCDADEVRHYVAAMRRHGTLVRLYSKPRARMESAE